MRGDDGNDDLGAGSGNDVVEGGLGFDVLAGGDGDDLLRDADGLADRIECGSGADTVEADTTDVVAADCESVSRVAVAAPPDVATNDTKPPVVRVGGPTLQRLRRGRVHLLATSSERGLLAASGSLDVAGISLPVQADRKRVTVAGGGVRLTIRLTRRHMRMCRRALARGRRASVRMFAVQPISPATPGARSRSGSACGARGLPPGNHPPWCVCAQVVGLRPNSALQRSGDHTTTGGMKCLRPGFFVLRP